MDCWDELPTPPASGTDGLRSFSVGNSTFGNDARLTQVNIESASFQSRRNFLRTLSSVDPRNDRDAVECPDAGPEESQAAFSNLFASGCILEQWLYQDRGQFSWINDETGLGHSLLASKIIGKTQEASSSQLWNSAWFFCKRPDNGKEDVTASQVIGGLAYTFLTEDHLESRLLPRIQKDYELRLDSSSNTCSRNLTILAKVLRDILHWIEQNDKERRILIVVDGIDGMNKHEIIKLLVQLEKLTRAYCNIKLLVSGKLSDEVQDELLRFTNTSNLVSLDAVQVATAFGLIGAIRMIADSASHLQEFRAKDGLKPAGDPMQIPSWFGYCRAARSWSRGPDLEPKQDTPKILWYRWYEADNLPACYLGRAIAQAPQNIGNFRHGAYFSFAEAFHDGLLSTLRPAQPLWFLWVQILTSHCNNELSLARCILGFPQQARDDLQSIHRIMESSAFSSSKTGLPNSENNDGTHGVFPDSWFASLLGVKLERMESLMTALMQSLTLSSERIVIIIDCLELLDPLGAMDLITFLHDLPTGFRTLLCLNQYAPVKSDFKAKWSRLVSPELVVDERTEYRECLDSLFFNNPGRRHIKNALNFTNQWLWSNEEFARWKNSSGLLWISGKAGSGKSVLAKSIQQHLSTRTKDASHCQPTLVFSWFYTADSEFGKRHDFMLRTLLRNILSLNATVFEIFKSYYRLWVDKEDRRLEWAMDSIQSVLEDDRSNRLIPRILAIIDGFDESDDDMALVSRQLTVIDVLDQLTKRCKSSIIILSRPETRFSDQLQGFPQILMKEHNQSDVFILIEDGIQRLRSVWTMESHRNGWSDARPHTHRNSPHLAELNLRDDTHEEGVLYTDLSQEQEEMLQHIRAYLRSHASGVILWVTVVLAQLEVDIRGDFSMQTLHETLESLPKELEGIYRYATRKLNIHGDSRKLAVGKTMLTWVMGSRRQGPLQLQQLRDALAIADQEGHTRSSTTPSIAKSRLQLSWSGFYHYVQKHCGSLLEIFSPQQSDRTRRQDSRNSPACNRQTMVLPTSLVQLLHQTVGTFLENEDACGELYIDNAFADSFVAIKSYQYLGIAPPSVTPIRPQRSEFEPLRRNTFAEFTKAVSPLPWREVQLLSLNQSRQDWPLMDFAMERVWQKYQVGVRLFEPLASIGQQQVSIAEGNPHISVHWVTDMCFVPTLPGTEIKDLIRSCCRQGRTDALLSIFRSIEKYRLKYAANSPYSRHLVSGRDIQILNGAIEALLDVDADVSPCRRNVALAIHVLRENVCQQRDQEQTSEIGNAGSMSEFDQLHERPLIHSATQVQSGKPQEMFRDDSRCCDGTYNSNVNTDGDSSDIVPCYLITEAISKTVDWVMMNGHHFRPFSGFTTSEQYERVPVPMLPDYLCNGVSRWTGGRKRKRGGP